MAASTESAEEHLPLFSIRFFFSCSYLFQFQLYYSVVEPHKQYHLFIFLKVVLLPKTKKYFLCILYNNRIFYSFFVNICGFINKPMLK